MFGFISDQMNLHLGLLLSVVMLNMKEKKINVEQIDMTKQNTLNDLSVDIKMQNTHNVNMFIQPFCIQLTHFNFFPPRPRQKSRVTITL